MRAEKRDENEIREEIGEGERHLDKERDMWTPRVTTRRYGERGEAMVGGEHLLPVSPRLICTFNR